MSGTRRAVAVFAMAMGSLLLGTWVVLFIAGAVEYGASPVELVFLLVAEAMTGLSLLTGGVATLRRRRWGAPSLLVALGTLLYCAAYSIGVFAGRGNIAATAWFAVLFPCTALAAALLVHDVGRNPAVQEAIGQM